MRIIRAIDHRLTRWKNGLGVTREVLAEPDPTDPAGFLWRVSIATVAADGPFSHFQGIDRSIAVLQGAGMRLTVDGNAVSLEPGSNPSRFPGEADVHSELIAGETTDLNAMSKRSSWTHSMRRLDIGQATTITGRAAVTLVVFGGAASVTGAGVDLYDVLADIAPGEHVEISAGARTDAFLIEFDPA